MKSAWKTETLGDACEIYQPKTISTKEMVDDGAYPVYGANGLIGHYNKFNHEEPQLLIACRGATCGSVNISAPRSWITGNAMVIRPKNASLQMRYMEYLFRGGIDISRAITGAAQPQITRTNLAPIKISYPVSVHEQARIVGILDKAFDGITQVCANAEKNLQNARELFESELQSVFADAWRTSELVPLSELATDITDGDHLPPPKSPTGVPFITIGNIVKETRKIDFSDTFMVPRAYFDGLKQNRKPRKGDLLYTVTGSFGIPVMVSEDVEFCFQRHIGLIRPNSDTNNTWLYYLLMSPQVSKQATDGATGTAQKTVSLKLLRSFEVPKMTLKRQQVLAAKLDSLSAEAQRLSSIYKRKLQTLDALKKSLLHQALTGNL